MATTIGAGEFKAKCLKLLDEVAETRETLVITKHGKPVAQVVPMPAEKNIIGARRGGVLSGGTVVITKPGKPGAQVGPMPAEKNHIGAMRGSVLWEGDIISPIDVEWEA